MFWAVFPGAGPPEVQTPGSPRRLRVQGTERRAGAWVVLGTWPAAESSFVVAAGQTTARSGGALEEEGSQTGLRKRPQVPSLAEHISCTA